jgi:hypothetical protein
MRRAGVLVLVLIVAAGAACGPARSTPVTPASGDPGSAGGAAAPAETREPASPSEVLAIQRAARPPEPMRLEITEASIRGHMEFLASDALQGRASGSRDEHLAVTYAGSLFRQWNLETVNDADGFVQQIETTPLEVTAPPVLRAGAAALVHGQDVLVQSIGAPTGLSGPLHRFEAGQPAPAGAVVLVPAGTAPAALAAAASASMWLTRETPADRATWSSAGSRLPSLPVRPVALGPNPSPRPARVVLSESAHDRIAALAPGTVMTLEVETRPAASRTFTWNAVAKITGADARLTHEVIVLSAHIDHIGAREVPAGQDGINNGADDDASGTIAVMELARALSRGPRPARTIVFALFGSEERGGHGAAYFVDLPVVPLDRIVLDLQFEMIGRPDPLVPAQTLWLTGYERSNLGPELARLGARLVADPHPSQNFFMRSDNIRFARRGVIAHTVSSFGLHTDYHRPSDEIATIDFAHMTEAIRSLLEPIRRLADSPFRPQWLPGGCPAPCR